MGSPWLLTTFLLAFVARALRSSDAEFLLGNLTDFGGAETSIKRVSYGWGLRCAEPCNPAGELGAIAALDELDAKSIRLVFILFRADKKWYRVKYCHFDRHGECLIQERLSQASHLISLPLTTKSESPDVLTFRGSAMKSWADINAKLTDEFSSDGTYTGWLLGSPTRWLEEKDLAESFGDRFLATKAALQPMEPEFMQEMRVLRVAEVQREAEQERLRMKLQRALPLLTALRAALAARLAKLPHKVSQCGVASESESLMREAWAMRAELDRKREEHRFEQLASLKDIAVQTFNVVFSTLAIVADVALPTVGSVAHIANQVTFGAAQAMNTFAEPEFISTLAAAAQHLKAVSSGAMPDISSIIPPALADPEFIELSLASESGALGEASDDLKRKLKEISYVGKVPTAGEAFEAAKDIMWSAVQSAATNTAWSAATYIPIIGPYVSLVQQVVGLTRTVLDMKASHADYLKWKDPILRSMFRLRDCQFAVLLDTPIQEDEVSSKPVELQEAAIRTALDAGLAAIELNRDLAKRLRKQGYLESRNDHEESVMRRLSSGDTKWYVGTRIPQAGGNDAYLPEHEVRPGDWQEQFEDLILESKASIEDAIAGKGI